MHEQAHPAIVSDFAVRTRIVAGAGCVDALGGLVRECGGGRALVVTDAGIVRAGHVERGLRSLRAAGVHASVFDAVHENPTTDDVDRCVEAARGASIDFIVGLGGGSALDVAKGCNFILTNGGKMRDYWGVGKATRPMLPFIAVPTTTGTGSEMQSFALIADADTHQKMACGDHGAAARVALLDPMLTVSQPPFVRACTGMDCIAHAVETMVTRRRNSVSSVFSRESLRLIVSSFERVLSRADDLDAELNMLFAASFAGIAIEASMLGAAHALANPITAKYGVVHGQAVGIMLPHVVAFNAKDDQARVLYALASRSAGLAANESDGDAAVAALVRWIGTMLSITGLGSPLRALGVQEAAIDELARQAAAQWTASFNPVAIGAADMARLYRAALE
jgi:alcohol dehydrogenase